ncbi:hypothetical protein N665_1422s0010 [Sinapis alba]|nr:hypothetical protein N665_1422s0010 [Sinapis alba]
MAKNESKLEGISPSQGDTYVGFRSSPGPAPSNQYGGGSNGDVFFLCIRHEPWSSLPRYYFYYSVLSCA